MIRFTIHSARGGIAVVLLAGLVTVAKRTQFRVPSARMRTFENPPRPGGLGNTTSQTSREMS